MKFFCRNEQYVYFFAYIGYTPREPVILPFKPINRPLKTDWYNGTTNNRPLDFFNSYSYDITDTHFLAFDEHFTDQS